MPTESKSLPAYRGRISGIFCSYLCLMPLVHPPYNYVLTPQPDGSYLFLKLSEPFTSFDKWCPTQKHYWLNILYNLKGQFYTAKNALGKDEFELPLFSALEVTHAVQTDFFKTQTSYGNLPLPDAPLPSSSNSPGTMSLPKLTCRFSREEYLRAFEKVQLHLQRGDIYEMNLCMEFYAENAWLDPLFLFQKVYSRTEAPFACLMKQGTVYLISASPERFLKKQGEKLISQPIKGTAKRSVDRAEDMEIVNRLKADRKELSENVMIVDLVRNDLSRVAERGTVNVDELFAVASLKTVHQLFSTISCQLKKDVRFQDIISATFPMGSMTGAPKLKAMELIDDIEITPRRLYSGTTGLYLPSGDFDLSVIIRSFIYNSLSGYLSLSTGSAVTVYADAEKEYKECLLKAEALMESLADIL